MLWLIYLSPQTHIFSQRDESEGNIFTGATPPWLLKEEPTGTAGCIGPTMEDYQIHCEY